jgi:hypothetical protein
MRATFAHWVLVLFLLSGWLPGERPVESPVKHAAEEESSSERQDESSKAAASRKRNARAQKTKRPRTPLLTATVWPSHTLTLLADDHRLSLSPATPWNPNLRQLHQVFRI